jgi:pSer/pThr/pTyr-binding forkhead associated (FHA) protein
MGSMSSVNELKERIDAERSGQPFLLYRDESNQQRLFGLEPDRDHVSVGRRDSSDLVLDWDEQVSRLHAQFERVEQDWTVVDDGLSRNGTWVNGERVVARRRLCDGDLVRVGGTPLAFCAPSREGRADVTLTAEGVPVGDVLTAAQRRVLVALCRPYRDSAFAAPASNPAIAAELSVSVDAVKSTMRALFDLFGVANLPQNQKRASLALQALRDGVISRRDL